jgi:succinate dehydrogenase / fumarate reductase iron-sulfur subunit
MVQFTLPKNSKIMEGQTWPLKHKAKGNKGTRAYRIYRFDPDSGANPRLDNYRSISTLRADGSRRADLDQAVRHDVPAVLSRGRLRLLSMNITHQLACTGTGDVTGTSASPLPHRWWSRTWCPPTPSTQHASVEPWLKTDGATTQKMAPNRIGQLDGLDAFCACCSTACRATGGTQRFLGPARCWAARWRRFA